ncbi:transposase [Colletotrichum chrysophilum]|uniref:Transposase n=1 Tax=Colletotrichum chrysophilum TaxID=1836956 RepID=A0AAD9E4M6_9PEZI|nr:transposase [Colletotrichum chrysophilum]
MGWFWEGLPRSQSGKSSLDHEPGYLSSSVYLLRAKHFIHWLSIREKQSSSSGFLLILTY